MNNQLTATNLAIALLLQGLMENNPAYPDHNIGDVIKSMFGRYGSRIKLLDPFLVELRKHNPPTANAMAINLTLQSNDEFEQDWIVPLYAFGFLLESDQMGLLKGSDHYLLDDYGNKWGDVEFQKKRARIWKAEVAGEYSRDFFANNRLHTNEDFPLRICVLIEQWYAKTFAQELQAQ